SSIRIPTSTHNSRPPQNEAKGKDLLGNEEGKITLDNCLAHGVLFCYNILLFITITVSINHFRVDARSLCQKRMITSRSNHCSMKRQNVLLPRSWTCGKCWEPGLNMPTSRDSARRSSWYWDWSSMRRRLNPPRSVRLRGNWGLTPQRLCAQWIASKNAAWWSAAAINMIAARSLLSLLTLAVPL